MFEQEGKKVKRNEKRGKGKMEGKKSRSESHCDENLVATVSKPNKHLRNITRNSEKKNRKRGREGEREFT